MVLLDDAVRAFLENCEARNLSPKTIASYAWALKKLDGHIELPLNTGDIVHIMATSPSLGREARYDLWRRLHRFYCWAAKAYDVACNPMVEIERPKRELKFPRTFELEEVFRIMTVTQGCPRDRAMVATFLDTGLRLAELAGLRRSHIQGTRIRVAQPKGGRERYVPVSPDVVELLESVGDDVHLWVSSEPGQRWGKPLSQVGVQQASKRILHRAGIAPPRVGPHTFRHTFARFYILNGGDAFSLQRILGHRNVKTTMIYVHMNTQDLEAQHAKVSPWKHFVEGADTKSSSA